MGEGTASYTELAESNNMALPRYNRLFLILIFYFFIKVQIQLSSLSHSQFPLSHPLPPPTLNPTHLWLCPWVLYTCSLSLFQMQPCRALRKKQEIGFGDSLLTLSHKAITMGQKCDVLLEFLAAFGSQGVKMKLSFQTSEP